MSDTVEIFVFNERITVPASLTILRALEYAGYRPVRGVGCRGGFCGACGTVYRLAGDHHLYVGLACQTMVQPGMYLAQIPLFPPVRPFYSLADMSANGEQILAVFPELLNCLGCNTCTKSCPQDLGVMDYVSDLLRGDLAAAADRSFDCIHCGLCVARCPAELSPPDAAQLARRLYARDLAPPSQHITERVAEIEAGAFDDELASLKATSEAGLRELYAAREIEA
jgi:ferredoxin